MSEYKLGKLDDKKLGHLKNILRYSKAEPSHIQFLTYNTHGIIVYDYKGVIFSTNSIIGKTKQTTYRFFQEEFNIKTDSIVSIHINEYKEG